MGADMSANMLILSNKTPDLDAICDYVRLNATDADVMMIDEEVYGGDEQMILGPTDLAQYVRNAIVDLTNSREVSHWRINDEYSIWITGGMTHGDPPTDAFESMNLLWSVMDFVTGFKQYIGAKYPHEITFTSPPPPMRPPATVEEADTLLNTLGGKHGT
jgi:hypothetical protein